ncbi:MAG: hypothetical protein FJ027_01515 [Candidatus Rokubacteria bacterium]|nr:hypothetical protein [Candidatus Rokubacteria bacterium]
MNVRRMLTGLMFLTAAVLGAAAPARAVDGVLYEVTEAVKVSSKGGLFKSSTATLSGDIAAGTALCPTWLAQQLNIPACSIVVRATGRADDVTGIGPASGDFQLIVQDANSADQAEVAILRGNIHGTIDLSPAFQKQQPVGSITGRFTSNGVNGTVGAQLKVSGDFKGTFRLPFRHAGRASYLMDDGTVVPVEAQEYSLGQAMVRLEVTFTPSK